MVKKKAKSKHIVLSEESRILFNKVRAKILHKNPKVNRLTDDLALQYSFKKYLEVD